MGNENYRETFENDRQEISLNSESSLSRRAQRNAAKQKPKQTKSLLLPVLFFIFILIPVMVLIYVAFLYEPTEPIMEASANNEVSVETNTASSEGPQLVAADDNEEKEKAEKAEAEAALKKEAEQERAAKEEEERKAAEREEAAAKAQAEKEAAAKAQAEKEAAAKAQAEKEAADKKAQEAQQQTPAPSGKTHVVQPNETLYRIAVNNYGAAGAGAAVERIKQANGLSSNEISVGQTLVLP